MKRLDFKEVFTCTIYLGNQIVFGRNRMKEFSRLKEKVQAHLVEWKNQLISWTGKATLIKFVIQVIPYYFWVSDGICNKFYALVLRFWLGANDSNRYLVLKSWDFICQAKEFGGLGFRKCKDINTALLTKLCWKLVIREESL